MFAPKGGSADRLQKGTARPVPAKREADLRDQRVG
jgi:hypothetical protein